MNYKKYMKPYIVAFILGPISMIIEVIGAVFMPKFLQMMMDEGIVGERGTGYVILMGGIMVITAVLMMAGGLGGAYFAIKASSGFCNDLRKDMFLKIQTFSFKNIDEFSTGSLVTRMTNDITQLQNFIIMLMRMALRAPGMLIGATIMAFYYSTSLAGIIAIVIPVLGFTLFLIMKIAFPRFTLMQKKLDKLNTRTQENLTNMRVVKSFVREEFEENKFEESSQDLKDKTLKAMNVVILTMPVMTLATNVTTIAVLLMGGKMLINGTIGVGVLTAFVNYITQILMSLMMLSMLILNSSRTFASVDRIKEVMNTETDIKDNISEGVNSVKKGKIQFKNVFFRYYENSGNVLNDIDFTINPGETVGLIGSTGSGKTSLVSLIPRLYDVSKGEVLIDDVNVKDYNLKDLRNDIGMILQKNILFSGSILDNLKWGKEEASEYEINKVTETSQAKSFIEGFTKGFDTVLGQGGVNVSGGQKQRICIARTLLKSPKIIILDDSTSAVDTATEHKIRKSFKEDYKEITKIIIAQRITSVMDADKIIVIDDGNITGIGKHEELIKGCEEYREIYNIQMKKEDNKNEE